MIKSRCVSLSSLWRSSRVFRAGEETNAVTLEFEIQSSENLQDWVAQPEKVTATLPLDAEKKFVRIALAQE